jgi:CheY-like chemotaxis protein
MNGVIGMTGLLLDTDLGAEQRKYAEIVKSSADSLLTLINDILDFSKIEAGRLDLEILDFDLRTHLEEMSDSLAVRAQEKGLEYICQTDPEVPLVLRGDPGRLRQVLTNLIGNAIKFTQEGEVSIHAVPETISDSKAKIRFLVSDTGIGIPRDRIDSLFEPFVQADASTTRKFGGTGLGLAISKQLIELMNGELRAESEVGKGSTFSFTVEFEVGSPSSSSGALVYEEIQSLRILVVDDNATNRLLMKQQLRAWGCTSDEAPDGKTALKKLKESTEQGVPFGIAILDMQMPGMDGEMLGKKIKEDVSLRNVSLVMMTSVGLRGDVARLKEIGFTAYLTKPVRQSQLFDCLSAVAGQRLGVEEVKETPIITQHVLREETNRRKARILLAEDNRTNQLVALKVLEKLRYRADAVANGLEAIRALGLVPYDLVLMDVQMPELDGLEATRRIRSAGSAVLDPQIPIIAMTAHAMKGDREMCLDSGMDGYISKPFNREELAQILEEFLSRGKKPKEGAQ